MRCDRAASMWLLTGPGCGGGAGMGRGRASLPPLLADGLLARL